MSDEHCQGCNDRLTVQDAPARGAGSSFQRLHCDALMAAETKAGANDTRVFAMPVDRMLAAMRKFGRMP